MVDISAIWFKMVIGYLAYCENNNYLNQRLFGALCQGSHQVKPFSEGAVPPSLEEQTSSLGSYGCQSEAHSSLHSRAQDSILCSISCLEWWENAVFVPPLAWRYFSLGSRHDRREQLCMFLFCSHLWTSIFWVKGHFAFSWIFKICL